MPDDERPAAGKLGPRAYDVTNADLREAATRATEDDAMSTIHDEAPKPLPEGEPENPPKRRPGHEAPDDAF